VQPKAQAGVLALLKQKYRRDAPSGTSQRYNKGLKQKRPGLTGAQF
jgi:hypothetical protein